MMLHVLCYFLYITTALMLDLNVVSINIHEATEEKEEKNISTKLTAMIPVY